MKRIKQFVFFPIIFSAMTSATFAQDSSAAAKLATQQGPNLDETISFMNNSVGPEDSYVTSVNDCELYVTRNRHYTFALPQSTYVKSTDGLGIPHYGFKWLIVEEPPRVARFRLSTIDPNSIKSKAVPSAAFVKEHDVDEHPEALKHPDLLLVRFEAANSERTIEEGHFKGSDDGSSATPVFDQKQSMDVLVFESQERAERFVTAFVHAVNLCGGKGDLFPPTPSKP
jgi:hypothetical protein